jgi:hypothetical protein
MREQEQRQQRLSAEEIMDLLCAPEPTDEVEDIEFDDDGAEEDFIRDWLREERIFRKGQEQAAVQTEVTRHV